jgi:hypothetical protein
MGFLELALAGLRIVARKAVNLTPIKRDSQAVVKPPPHLFFK